MKRTKALIAAALVAVIMSPIAIWGQGAPQPIPLEKAQISYLTKQPMGTVITLHMMSGRSFTGKLVGLKGEEGVSAIVLEIGQGENINHGSFKLTSLEGVTWKPGQAPRHVPDCPCDLCFKKSKKK